MKKYNTRNYIEDLFDIILYREFILRKYLNFCTKDYKDVFINDVNRFLEWHENETNQGKMDMFGAQGVDLTDSRFDDQNGRNYYRDWSDQVRKKAERYKDAAPKERIDKAAIEKKARQFDEVAQRIVQKRKAIEMARGQQAEGKIIP